MNILAILQDFKEIFLKYSLNITMLCGHNCSKELIFENRKWEFTEPQHENIHRTYPRNEKIL